MRPKLERTVGACPVRRKAYRPWRAEAATTDKLSAMSVSSVDSIERAVHKANDWLNDLSRELATTNREFAWRVLRAYLQILRDRLTIDEAAQLAAQLPRLLRGAFYEGFDPGHHPEKIRDRETLLAEFVERAQLPDPEDGPAALAAATRVLRLHVTHGEVCDVVAQMPADIREALAGR